MKEIEKLIRQMARKLAFRLPPVVGVNDLMQAGWLGVYKHKDGFDPELGLKFSTYIYPYIKREMWDEIRQWQFGPRNSDPMQTEEFQEWMAAENPLDSQREADDRERTRQKCYCLCYLLGREDISFRPIWDHHLKGLSVEQTAIANAMSERQVKYLLTRGYKKLKEKAA